MDRKRIAVLMGGRSAEREVSLKTGAQVIKALESRGHEAIGIDAGDDLALRIKEATPDACFIALHGRYGEDGTIQGLLEFLGIPYTGSGVLASAVGMDKIASKKIFLADGIPTPEFAILAEEEYRKDPNGTVTAIAESIGFPSAIKPAREGSTIGMTIVNEKSQLPEALEVAFDCDDRILAERFVKGTEITIGVLGNDPVALPTLEVVTKTGFYDYETKYTAGLSEHIIPARIPPEQAELAQELAVKTHKAIGCRGFSRVDFIIDEDGRAYVLEINTIPGMTELSLFPDAARAAGIEFDALVERLVELALPL